MELENLGEGDGDQDGFMTEGKRRRESVGVGSVLDGPVSTRRQSTRSGVSSRRSSRISGISGIPAGPEHDAEALAHVCPAFAFRLVSSAFFFSLFSFFFVITSYSTLDTISILVDRPYSLDFLRVLPRFAPSHFSFLFFV